MNNRENAGSACPSIVTLVVQLSGLVFVCSSQVGILSKWMNVSSWFVVQKLSRQARSHAATRLAIRGSHATFPPPRLLPAYAVFYPPVNQKRRRKKAHGAIPTGWCRGEAASK